MEMSQQTTPTAPRWKSPKEVAAELGYHVRTVLNWVREGGVVHFRESDTGRVRILVDELGRPVREATGEKR